LCVELGGSWKVLKLLVVARIDLRLKPPIISLGRVPPANEMAWRPRWSRSEILTTSASHCPEIFVDDSIRRLLSNLR
jgi:hypothetical protein